MNGAKDPSLPSSTEGVHMGKRNSSPYRMRSLSRSSSCLRSFGVRSKLAELSSGFSEFVEVSELMGAARAEVDPGRRQPAVRIETSNLCRK